MYLVSYSNVLQWVGFSDCQDPFEIGSFPIPIQSLKGLDTFSDPVEKKDHTRS